MFNKLTLSALGLMAAVTGPMVFFAVSKPAVSLPTGPVQATPDRSLTEVFQFNITPEWIMRCWPQVATGLDQVQLQGYRVPLISGTAESDVAGADLLLQRPAATAADHLSGQHGRPAQAHRPAAEPLPTDVAADQRSGPGGL